MRFRIIMSVLVTAVLLLGGCAPKLQDAEKPGPVSAVEGLLELRSNAATDPARYKAYLMSQQVADSIAAEASRTESRTPFPAWRSPELIDETTSTADVRVEWVRSDEVTAWPSYTTFRLFNDKGAWRVIDALESTATLK